MLCLSVFEMSNKDHQLSKKVSNEEFSHTLT